MDEMAQTGFGRGALAYSRARPGWPAEAVAAAFGHWGISPAGSSVLDLGAGTGRLTAVLAATGADVTAVEPVAEMRALIESRSVEGTAEEIPAADDSVDAVFVGEAFHWFDFDRAVPELARVLRPGGGLALLWNGWPMGEESWRADFAALLSEVHYHPQGLSMASAGEDRFEGLRGVAFDGFAPFERMSFEHARLLTPEQFADLVSSFSFVAALPDGRRDELLGRLLDLLRSEHVDEINQRWQTNLFVAAAI